ncbi:unnamed protein product [Nezara viridula]|uniref:Uncharacterized protein n=1 Tax=Nezara viridula TaxID=85310 RepID=A0A9P0H2Q0_NEZVI|nr:unnamed protein product [Nezara viridula]
MKVTDCASGDLFLSALCHVVSPTAPLRLGNTDIPELHEENWKATAQGRKRWRRIVRVGKESTYRELFRKYYKIPSEMWKS